MRRYTILLLVLLALAACKPTATPTSEAPTPEPPAHTPTFASPISPLPLESPLTSPELPQRSSPILLVVAQEGFNDDEYSQPRAAFEAAGYAVDVAALSRDVASGMHGLQVEPDLTLAEAEASSYSAVVFVGGSGAMSLWDDAQAHRLAQEATEQGKVVAAICIAPVLLARAGVLEGKEATVFDADRLCAELESGGALCTGAAVQRDGRLVTANGPQAAEDFGRAVLDAMQE